LFILGGKLPGKNDKLPKEQPRVSVAYLKYQWATGERKAAFERLREFTKSITSDDELLAKCHLRLGTWESELHDTLDDVCVAVFP
jgi:hypothetical protein